MLSAFSEYDLEIQLEDWSLIEFEQNFQFDDFKDITMLLSDTDISPYLENWYSVYNRELLKIPHPPNMKESRRVLIEILKREEISCRHPRNYTRRESPEILEYHRCTCEGEGAQDQSQIVCYDVCGNAPVLCHDREEFS